MHLDVAVDEMVGVLEVVLFGGNDIPEGLLGGLGVEGKYVYYTFAYIRYFSHCWGKPML